MGYRINLLATPDTAYQNMEAVIFGADGRLLDYRFHAPDKLPADRDKRVIDHLVARIRGEPKGGQFNIIALDSTHFDYGWGADFTPKFIPYAKDSSLARDYQGDPLVRKRIFNRYKNSVVWIDSLVGRALQALDDQGRSKDSLIIITGDHGEAFWEHGSGTHGSDLSREQLEIALAIQLPNGGGRRIATVFSLMDVIPTILEHLGQGDLARRLLPGTAAQRRAMAESNTTPAAAALTFQGWNERAFRFALTTQRQRTIFELDRPHPLDARTLSIVDLTDLNDRSLVRQHDTGDEYRAMLQGWPALMKELPFLVF